MIRPFRSAFLFVFTTAYSTFALGSVTEIPRQTGVQRAAYEGNAVTELDRYLVTHGLSAEAFKRLNAPSWRAAYLQIKSVGDWKRREARVIARLRNLRVPDAKEFVQRYPELVLMPDAVLALAQKELSTHWTRPGELSVKPTMLLVGALRLRELIMVRRLVSRELGLRTKTTLDTRTSMFHSFLFSYDSDAQDYQAVMERRNRMLWSATAENLRSELGRALPPDLTRELYLKRVAARH